MMYAGLNSINYCKDNFKWTTKTITDFNDSSFVPIDVSRYNDCALKELEIII